MSFIIQVSNPKILFNVELDVEDVAHAIQVIFPMKTEDALLFWNGIPIRMNYKYDISIIIEDLLLLLSELLKRDNGTFDLILGSDTLDANWNIVWAKKQLTIVAKWNNIHGGYEFLPNNSHKLDLALDSFLFEWKLLLRKLIEAITKSSVRIKNRNSIDFLITIESAIINYGDLYSD